VSSHALPAGALSLTRISPDRPCGKACLSEFEISSLRIRPQGSAASSPNDTASSSSFSVTASGSDAYERNRFTVRFRM
jgi:hypothetical protein